MISKAQDLKLQSSRRIEWLTRYALNTYFLVLMRLLLIKGGTLFVIPYKSRISTLKEDKYCEKEA